VEIVLEQLGKSSKKEKLLEEIDAPRLLF